VLGIDTTKYDFTTSGVISVSGKIKGEDGSFNGVLGDHLIEDWGYSQNGDLRISKSKDTVEFTGDERETRLLQDFGEGLLGDLKTRNIDVITGELSRYSTRSISDVEGSSISNVASRLVSVVLVVQQACDVGNGTF